MNYKVCSMIVFEIIIMHGEAKDSIISDIVSNNASKNLVQHTDSIGLLVNIIDRIYTNFHKGKPAPKKEKCKPHLIHFGKFEVKFSENPVGYCPYCCPMHNPSQYVRLYFTNKSSAGKMKELKLKKKLPGELRAAGINTSSDTVIFIHGFTEHGLGPSALVVRNAYLSRKDDYNIILVDWGDLSSLPWYPQAVRSTRIVGLLLAKFIKFYSDTGELPISKIHIIGFSLGAHIAGFIGKFFKEPYRIPRITGLDPAMPLFPFDDPTKRISKLDAEFVDVIHTDAGKFGFPISIGHADFYPNGGTYVQPGCRITELTDNKLVHQIGTCSHIRAWILYIESVQNPEAFPATRCDAVNKANLKNCRFVTESFMGFAANKSARGNFYLTTNKNEPFSKSAIEQEGDMKNINLIEYSR